MKVRVDKVYAHHAAPYVDVKYSVDGLVERITGEARWIDTLQLAQKHTRRDLEDMFSSYVTATDRDQHWHHGRIESVSPPSQRGFFS